VLSRPSIECDICWLGATITTQAQPGPEMTDDAVLDFCRSSRQDIKAMNTQQLQRALSWFELGTIHNGTHALAASLFPMFNPASSAILQL
jgi:hypothetical protein